MDHKYNSPKTRTRRLNIRLSEKEWDKVHELAANTTCRSVSDYVRKILTGKPVTIFYRNQSFDEFEERMVALMPLLEGWEKEIKGVIEALPPPYRVWDFGEALTLIADRFQNYFQAVEEIRKHLEKLSDTCGQK